MISKRMDNLPPGVRFYPTEEELISFYLHNKLEGKGPQLDHVIPVVDIYDHNPWVLQQYTGTYCRKDPEQWFFFIPMQEKEARGCRPNRLTNEGYWKATGSPRYVYSSNNRIIGMKRTMVFYQGRAPNDKKTEWKMNEYKAIEGEASSSSSGAPPKWRQELSLCRIYIKSKCVRSFDRRPPGIETVVIEEAARQPLHVKDHVITTHHQHQPPPVDQNMSISGGSSSSSGEHFNTSLETGNINWDMGLMVFDNEPWWDLQQVIWD